MNFRVLAVADGAINSNAVAKASDVMIGADRCQVILDGREIDQTAKEFDLLLHLVRNPGRVSTREQLLDFVWGYKHTGCQYTVNSQRNVR